MKPVEPSSKLLSMSDSMEKARLKVLEGLFQALLERKADKTAVEACNPWSDQATPEDVAFLIDRAIDKGADFDVLKPAVAKLFNLLYAPLARYRYKSNEGELFLDSLLRENRGAVELLSGAKATVAGMNALPAVPGAGIAELRSFLDKLESLEVHYRKKENILFPRFESRYPEYRCVRLMWSIQDDVRRSMRRLRELVQESPPLLSELNGEIGKLYFNIHAVIFREECVVFPILAKLFSREELNGMFVESADFGFCFLSDEEQKNLQEEARGLSRAGTDNKESRPRPRAGGAERSPAESLVPLETGALPVETLGALFRALPVDLSFVDSNDRLAWFSDGPHRIFPRSPSSLGRDVRNCHPKESVDRVVAILDSFKQGRKNSEAFWIQRKGRFIHIEYFALRDPGGRYLGTLEVSQDLTEKRALSGEKRLAGG